VAVAVTDSESGPKRESRRDSTSTFVRVARYSALRLVTLFATVVIGVYLTIMIANMGGYVDQILRGEIRERVTQMFVNSPTYRAMAPDARQQLLATAIAQEENRIGLNTPVAVRNFRYLLDALTLNLGRAQNMTSDSGSKEVRVIILERLPATLLLMGTSEISLFFISVFLALGLSRRYGTRWDKLIITLSPSSAAPPWFYGIFFILIFAAVLKILPFGGMTDSPPPANPVDFALNVLPHILQRGLRGDGQGQGTAGP
jgi:peptide/nickel transport system permease protein